MKKVFLVHGYGGNPNGGWRPWLRNELAKIGIESELLYMPNPNLPNKKNWVNTIKVAVGETNKDVFLIGHSLGGTAIMRYLESLDSSSEIGGVVLVSSPKKIEAKSLRSFIKKMILFSFFNKPFNYSHIREVCNKFVVIHGDDDKMVSLIQAKEISRDLNARLIIIPNGGHLNEDSNYYELPEAFTALQELIK